MTKKRDQIKRRRQVHRTRDGLQRPPAKAARPPVAKKKEEQLQMKDVWLAVGIVVVIIAVFVVLYQVSKNAPASPAGTTPTVSETTGITPTVSATIAATSTVTTTSDAGTGALSWSEPPAMQIDPTKDYEAILKTEKGDVRIQLYADVAPNTVNNFVFLARQGYYDGVMFHRVLEGFMAQTGDPTGTGRGGPGYTIEDEFDDSLTHDGPGVVSMANTGLPDSGGSQFFITYTATSHLDGKHAVFGRVIEGMEVVESLTPRNPEQDNQPEGDKILSVEIVES
ncbi:MAG: peptidylprolyl isomerase [Anaerolineae bacterium]